MILSISQSNLSYQHFLLYLLFSFLFELDLQKELFIRGHKIFINLIFCDCLLDNHTHIWRVNLKKVIIGVYISPIPKIWIFLLSKVNTFLHESNFMNRDILIVEYIYI